MHSPLRTSTLTRTLKPSPKAALASPGVHQGRRSSGDADERLGRFRTDMRAPTTAVWSSRVGELQDRAGWNGSDGDAGVGGGERGEVRRGRRDPAEDAA